MTTNNFTVSKENDDSM